MVKKQIVHDSTNISLLLIEKLIYYKDIVRKTMLSVQKYKKMDIIGASELNVCLNGLETLYEQLNILHKETMSTNQLDECISKAQLISNEIATIIKTFGTENIEDLINICFGSDFIKSSIKPDVIDKFNIISKYTHPISYNIIMWKDNKLLPKNSSNKPICKTRLVEEHVIVDQAETLDCFDMARISGVFQIKVYGTKIAIQNEKLGKTLIVSSVVDDLLLNCIEMPFIKTRLQNLSEQKPDVIEKSVDSYDKYINSITIKDLLIYNNDDIYTKYLGYMSQAHQLKSKSINNVINEFVHTDLYSKRMTLIHLLLKSSEYEYQYLAYLLYDLLSNDEVNSSDSFEQTMIFDSFSWNIKKYFRDAMKKTISYTNQLSNFDDNKIPLEQQICLMKVGENVKEKAMAKLKEVKSKSDDSGSKARQYLEGLLKIPFGVYREEEVLFVMKTMTSIFSSIINTISDFSLDLITDNNLILKKDYTSVEVSKYILIIKSIVLPNLLKFIIKKINDDIKSYNRSETISIINKFNSILKKHHFKNGKILHSGKSIKEIRENISHILNNDNDEMINDLINKFNPSYNLMTTISRDIKKIDTTWDEIGLYMNMINNTLDKSVYGHKKAKCQIERIIGQWINGKNTGHCFGFEGPPGVGKTSLAKHGIANCLKDSDGTSRPFAFIALGGSSNSSTLNGHNYTYVGSTWGRIVDILIETKCLNPIIFIDELDKVSRTEAGREIIGILTHLVDPTQNDSFQDKYFNGIDIDLSKVLFIFSYNDAELLDRILLDRIHRVRFKHLSLQEKLVITKMFIMPETLELMGLVDNIQISDDVVEYIIEEFTCEAGVRKLKEIIFEIIGEINLKFIKSPNSFELPINLSVADIDFYLKERQHVLKKKIHNNPSIGIINGLWANAVGQGGIIQIEAKYFVSGTLLDLKLTGMQGDVMKESMTVAKTLAWTLTPSSLSTNLVKNFNKSKNQGVHIHCPEGAVPKDGPSAGTAITTVLYSLLNNKKIKNDIAITGEICLQGNVTAIGGLDLKILGGIKAGVKTFLFPKENHKDFVEFMELYENTPIIQEITFIEIDTIHDVFNHVFI